MKRAFTHKVESVPSCGADKDALAKLSEGKLPGKVVNSLNPPALEGNRRVRTSAAMIGLAISMGVLPLLLPEQGDEAIAAEPTSAEPIVSTPTAWEVAVVSPSLNVEQPNDPSKQPNAEPHATTASLQFLIARDNKVPFGQNLGQVSTTYKLDAAPMATANGFKSSLVGTQPQVLKISSATRIANEIKPANTAVQQSDKVQSTQLEQSVLPSVVTNLDFEPKQSVVALPEPMASIPNPVITSIQSQEKQMSLPAPAMTVASPVVMPQTMAAIPVASIRQGTTTANLVIDPVKTSATSATLAVPKPVVVEPQATAVPERLYQVKPGDTVEALAQTYGVSPTEILRRNHLENPNLIQVNQALRIPPTNTTTIISSDPGVSISQYPVTSQETQAYSVAEETKPAVAASPVVLPSNNTKALDWNSAISQASAPANSEAIQIPVISPSSNTKAPAKTRTANQASAPAASNATKIPVLLPLNSTKTPAQNNSTNQASAPTASNAPKILVWPLFNNAKTPAQNQPASGDNPVDAPTKIGVIPIPVPKPLIHTKPQEQNQPAIRGIQSSSTASSKRGAITNSAPTSLNMPKPQMENIPTGGDAQPDSPLPANSGPIPIHVHPPQVATAPTESVYYNPNMQTPTGETVTPQLPGSQEPNPYPPLDLQGYMWPAKGVITSGFGMRWGRMHKGIDIAAPIGTPIFASATGVVVHAGWNSGGYGNVVDIQHPDGSLTRYAHNSRILVQVGQGVEQGQEISEMGNTGHSTGPHCHFEVHPPGKGAVNPIAYLPPHTNS